MAGMNDTAEMVTLANGVRIAFDPMPLATTALGVWVRVGARWEEARENGIAHLFEHMAFKGAGSRNAAQFVEAIEAVGGYLNASTGYERTNYTARTLKEDAPFALDLIADMMFDPHWKPDDLELEKNVVAQERNDANDAPDDRVFEMHQSEVFKNQPLGRPILGTKESVADVRVDDLIRFRAQHTVADRVVISVAGGYERDAILEIAHKRFGHLAKGDAQYMPKGAPGAGEAVEARKLEQTHLVFSVGGVGANDERARALGLLAEILGGGMASRLFQEVREKRGLVYNISAWSESYEDVGRFGFYASCEAAKAKEVARCVADAMATIAAHGVTEAELARAKAVTIASMLMGAESPGARAESRAQQIFLFNEVRPFQVFRNKVEDVDRDTLKAVAELALAGPKGATAIGPKPGLAASGVFHKSFA
jgi:predicted Zn-dependent peptidase